jgi:hypothetical protein
LTAGSIRKLVNYVWKTVLLAREYHTNTMKERLILECGVILMMKHPSVTAQSVNKHAVTLVNILDSRRSFLLKYAPINAVNIVATKSKRTVIIQTDTEKILDIVVTRDSCLPHRAIHTAL